MRVALTHDYLSQDGGAEKVLESLMGLYPDAPTYTLFYDADAIPRFKSKDIRSSFLQKLPLIRSKYPWYLSLMPSAMERHDLSGYDVVISNDSAFAKGVIIHPGTTHICYCHTPTRYLWSDTVGYVEELRQPRIVKSFLPPLLSYLRLLDQQAAARVDHFIANSKTVAARIKRYYHRDSTVIYPPVQVEQFSIHAHQGDYFLAGGRLVAYKRFDLIVEAANKTGIPVKIFGTGPLRESLERKAASNIEFLGKVNVDRLAALYAQARAYLHPQVEDLGITPIESMASGRPVIAFGQGGATETIRPGETGLFLERQTWEELADAMIRFKTSDFDPQRIRAHALTFRPERYAQEMKDFVARVTEPRT